MSAGILTGCGKETSNTSTTGEISSTSESKTESKASSEESNSGEKDVVTALLPPVSATYQEKINTYVDNFNSTKFLPLSLDCICCTHSGNAIPKNLLFCLLIEKGEDKALSCCLVMANC